MSLNLKKIFLIFDAKVAEKWASWTYRKFFKEYKKKLVFRTDVIKQW